MQRAFLVVLLAVAAAGSASAVDMFVDAGNFGQEGVPGVAQYVFNGGVPDAGRDRRGSFMYSDFPLNTWGQVYIQPATIGFVKVVDAGNGNYDVVVRASMDDNDTTPVPGLVGTTGTANPTLSFVNKPVTINRGPNYQGSWTVNWLTTRNNGTSTINAPVPLPGNSYWGWLGSGSGCGGFVYGVDASGNVTFNGSAPANLPYTASGNTLSLPAGQEVRYTVSAKPPQAGWIVLDCAGLSGFNNSTVFLPPTDFGGYTLLGDMGPGHWDNGQSGYGGVTISIPASTRGWSVTRTWTDDQNNVYTFKFSGPNILGDTNGDAKVDFADYLNLESSFGNPPTSAEADADFDDNGVVDFADYLVLESAYGTGTSTVPEPMTLSLLGLAGLAMLRRRK